MKKRNNSSLFHARGSILAALFAISINQLSGSTDLIDLAKGGSVDYVLNTLKQKATSANCIELKFKAIEYLFENGEKKDGAQITITSTIDPFGNAISIHADPYRQTGGDSFKTISVFDGKEWKAKLTPLDADGKEEKGVVTIDKKRNADFGDTSEGYLTGEAMIFTRFLIAKGISISDPSKYYDKWKMSNNSDGTVSMSYNDDCSSQSLTIMVTPESFPTITHYRKIMGKCDTSLLEFDYEFNKSFSELVFFNKKILIPSGYVRRVFSGGVMRNETHVSLDSVKIVGRDAKTFDFEVPIGWQVRDLISGFVYTNGQDDVKDIR
jgi:hypothetical protein